LGKSPNKINYISQVINAVSEGGPVLILRLSAAMILLFNALFASNVYAYIDPNTGGFFFQSVAPFVYGILGVIVIFWKRITGFVKGLFGRNKGDNSTDRNE
jgi:hypothetical protein